MKRKLNDDDVPVAVETETSAASSSAAFSSLGLDSRLLQAVAKQNFTTPTSVQAKAIPLALAGKDILARSKTGSGKTAAYVLPILQSILQKKINAKILKATSTLVLVPTRELAQQVSKAISTFSAFCAKDVRTINLTQKVPDSVQRSLLAEFPDVVVATPARAAQNLDSGALIVDNLTHLVIDEADLVLSYGYDEDLQTLSKVIPKGLQTFLMSATLTTDVDTLKGLFCRNPVVVDFQEKESEGGGVSQYVVKCGEDEKFLLAYVVFKLKLIKGKCIIFVGDIDRCYRLKLFFEQFSIKSCVLNSELPVKSRIHVVEEFNKNVYDIIIASDEHEIVGEIKSSSGPKKATTEDAGITTVDNPENEISIPTITPTDPAPKRQKKSRKAKEYGISRGIDFQHVACVLNFDLPPNPQSYTHRIGRTARAGATGLALSFAIPASLYGKNKSTTYPTTAADSTVLEAIIADQANKGKEIKPYHFDKAQIEGFRYRMLSALKSVTRLAVREARAKELRQELLKSEKLSRYFEENPDEKRELRHDNESRVLRVRGELKHVPEYLMPATTRGELGKGGQLGGFVPLRKESDNRIRRARVMKARMGKGKPRGGRGGNVLRSFRAGGRK